MSFAPEFDTLVLISGTQRRALSCWVENNVIPQVGIEFKTVRQCPTVRFVLIMQR